MFKNKEFTCSPLDLFVFQSMELGNASLKLKHRPSLVRDCNYKVTNMNIMSCHIKTDDVNKMLEKLSLYTDYA